MIRFPVRWLLAAVVFPLVQTTGAHAAPVIIGHPRLLLTDAAKSRLLAKKNANDASWQTLKARADTLAAYSIFPYKFATNRSAPEGMIYYTYQGEGWHDATIPLAFAYQMTGDTRYSNKLIELAQEMIRAQSDPENNPPNGVPPIRLDNYYASRNVMSVLAFIYDYCYDQLSPSLRSQIITLMNDYFDDASVNGYQAQNYSWAADGNFFGGHLYGVALMGYASSGDNPRAQEMIEWARIRFDGLRGPTVSESKVPLSWRAQSFDGGQKPAVALDYLGPEITGAPFKGGFDFQGWSYGSEEYSRMIDYMLIVRSATGEDIITPHINWFSQILRAEKHALFPNRFMIDPSGDWGGFQGAVIPRTLPIRLAFILAGTADGPAAQHLAYSAIAESTIPDVQIYPPPEWVDLFFTDSSRQSSELTLPPYYTGFAPNYPAAATSPGATNGAMPYFIMRSDWSASATWSSIYMGAQWWDDHQQFDAGHMIVARGGDYLLVSATDWKTETNANGTPIYGRSGVLGDSLQLLQSSLNNTLYFDDFGDFQSTEASGSGGQSGVGIDQVVADELNQNFSYVRSDLSTAYNRAGEQADTPNRRLDFFYRNFLYLRAANVFVVYDQVQAKPSSNPRGAYKKHIRWHLPERPTIAGTMTRVDHGQSRLFIDTVLPNNASLKVVDEWTNPDPCDGSVPGCVPFGANAATFRVEVSDPQNPLFIPFLTVLQPGSSGTTAPINTRVASPDGKMIGVEITQAGGAHSIVLFNNQPGPVPQPITSTSYNFPGSGVVTHTLTGFVPGARYAVVLTAGVVRVDQNPAGDQTASPAGVLHFTLSSAATACIPNANTLCFVNNLYRVTLTAADVPSRSNRTAVGEANTQTLDTGYFTLSGLTGSTQNPEVVVKVLQVPASFVPPGASPSWVFFGGLTDLEYFLSVTDTQTGGVRQYHKFPGTVQNGFDIGDGQRPAAETVPGQVCPLMPQFTTVTEAPSACISGANQLCLSGSRFKVTLNATNRNAGPDNGAQAPGVSVPKNDLFGFFSTPGLTGNPNNLEAFIKILDARVVNGKFWVFFGTLTNFELRISVTDTTTGQKKTYFRPGGAGADSACGAADTAAFPF